MCLRLINCKDKHQDKNRIKIKLTKLMKMLVCPALPRLPCHDCMVGLDLELSGSYSQRGLTILYSLMLAASLAVLMTLTS